MKILRSRWKSDVIGDGWRRGRGGLSVVAPSPDLIGRGCGGDALDLPPPFSFCLLFSFSYLPLYKLSLTRIDKKSAI